MRLKGNLSEFPDSSKLMITAGIMLFMMVSSYLLGGLLCNWFYGFNIFSNPKILDDYTNSEVINSLKLLQLLSSVFTFIITAFLCGFLFGNGTKDYLQLNNTYSKLIIFAMLVALFSFPFINFLAEWNSHLTLPTAMKSIEKWMNDNEQHAAKLTEVFLNQSSLAALLFNLFLVALIPAVGEELLFRGVLQKLFISMTKNVHAGIIIGGIVFSAFHMQFMGFIPRMLFGMSFGYMLVWSKSLWLPIAAHFTNNALTVIVVYTSQFYKMPLDIETLGTKQNESIYVFVSVVLIGFNLFMIYRDKPKIDSASTYR